MKRISSSEQTKQSSHIKNKETKIIMKKEDPSMKNTSQMLNDQQQDPSFELNDQSSSQEDIPEVSHGRYRRGSDSEDEITDIFDAIRKGNEKAIERFLKKVNINIEDDGGNTPLHIAVKENRRNIVGLLLKKDPNINASNHKFNTPLHIAIKKNYPDIAKLLIEKGANVEANNPNLDHRTPLALIEERLKENPNGPWKRINELC